MSPPREKLDPAHVLDTVRQDTFERVREPSERRGVFLITTGGAVGRIVPLSGSKPVTFGRAPDCTVPLPDTGISRNHAEVTIRAGEYVLRDVGSTNGTFVNEARVELAAILEHGDSVRLGSGTRMRFTLIDAAEERDLLNTQGAFAREARRLTPGTERTEGAPSVIRAPAMRALYEQAGLAARSNISVLLLGETGVGKEVLARAIHRASPRVDKPFLALHCAALPESLLEAELFGHEQGSFTGALKARAGLFEAAEGGTVFLDEVGELPLAVQVKLLRVLEDRTVLRIGARAARAVDVRFVAATNRDLEADAARGTFRPDLFFRLNGMTLTIPPLRERKAEILDLAELFVADVCSGLGRADAPSLADETKARLLEHGWPGNARELRNVIERAVVLCAGSRLLPAHLPPSMMAKTDGDPAKPSRAAQSAQRSDGAEDPGALRERLAAAEKQRVLDALTRCGGNQTRAAAELGISRRTLVTRLQEWGLTKPRQRDSAD